MRIKDKASGRVRIKDKALGRVRIKDNVSKSAGLHSVCGDKEVIPD